jgi:hypothetical protein
MTRCKKKPKPLGSKIGRKHKMLKINVVYEAFHLGETII